MRGFRGVDNKHVLGFRPHLIMRLLLLLKLTTQHKHRIKQKSVQFLKKVVDYSKSFSTNTQKSAFKKRVKRISTYRSVLVFDGSVTQENTGIADLRGVVFLLQKHQPVLELVALQGERGVTSRMVK